MALIAGAAVGRARASVGSRLPDSRRRALTVELVRPFRFEVDRVRTWSSGRPLESRCLIRTVYP